MPEPLIVVGAGGFGREVIDIVDAANASARTPVWELVGVVDDDPREENLKRLAERTVPYLGTCKACVASHPGANYVVGIGAPSVRRDVAEFLNAAGWKAVALVHPGATIGSQATIGDGTVLCAGARVSTNVTLGRHVHLDVNVTVGHDSVLGDFVRANPASSISGDCVVESDVLLGVAGVILNGLTVGSGATVGGAACVVRDVSPGAVVKGVPAR